MASLAGCSEEVIDMCCLLCGTHTLFYHKMVRVLPNEEKSSAICVSCMGILAGLVKRQRQDVLGRGLDQIHDESIAEKFVRLGQTESRVNSNVSEDSPFVGKEVTP